MTFEEKIQLIKDRINIFNLCNRLFPGHKLGRSCRCPWRTDNNPSFSVTDDGKLFNDFTNSEGGDVFKFYQIATGCTFVDSFKYLSEIAGIDEEGNARPIIRPVVEKKKEEKVIVDHPKLDVPTEDEIKEISNLRSITAEGLQVAVDRRFLWTSTIMNHRAYVITDDARRCYSARRMDGLTWGQGKDTGWSPKAFTLHGSDATRPLGVDQSKSFPAIAVCEGGPDFLAAFDWAYVSGLDHLIAPICVLSSSVKEMPYVDFVSKKIRIFAHADEPGQKAGKRWCNQLRRVAKYIDVFDFSGLIRYDCEPVKDLNDMLNVRVDCFKDNIERILGCMDFCIT